MPLGLRTRIVASALLLLFLVAVQAVVFYRLEADLFRSVGRLQEYIEGRREPGEPLSEDEYCAIRDVILIAKTTNRLWWLLVLEIPVFVAAVGLVAVRTRSDESPRPRE